MTATINPIQPTTELFVFTANADGYTLFDSVLGNQSASEYRRIVISNGDTREKAIADLCDWLRYAEGFFSTEEEAEAWMTELSERGERTYARTLESFTPESIHDEIMAMGENEN